MEGAALVITLLHELVICSQHRKKKKNAMKFFLNLNSASVTIVFIRKLRKSFRISYLSRNLVGAVLCREDVPGVCLWRGICQAWKHLRKAQKLHHWYKNKVTSCYLVEQLWNREKTIFFFWCCIRKVNFCCAHASLLKRTSKMKVDVAQPKLSWK